MDEMTVFEQRFEKRVRIFAAEAVRAVDSAAVAHAAASAAGRHRSPGRRLAFPRGSRAWTIAVAVGLLAVLLGAALLVGARLLVPPLPVTNGWIAFTTEQPAAEGVDGDLDIWLVALDREARRVVGSETDHVHQLCPAFSVDGRRLAYGQVEGNRTRAALVIADVTRDGQVSDRLSIDVGDGLAPPCPVWSPDGRHMAFGVNATSPINPQRSAAGSEVWIVTLADRSKTVLPDLLATDLDWSPDGRLLGIASGTDDVVPGEVLGDGLLHLYATESGSARPIDGTDGAVELTWSPDGRSIVYSGLAPAGSDDGRELRVIDVDTGRQRTLATRYGTLHGIGPVWSPNGDTVAYQRGVGGEHSEVVLMKSGDLWDESVRPTEAIVPVTARGSGDRLDPYRVTWSPDGRYLLMMAWGHPPDAPRTVEDPFLAAIPVDPAKPNTVLSRLAGLVPYDGYPDTTFVPIGMWGRAPPD